jgi:hypothetical protein
MSTFTRNILWTLALAAGVVSQCSAQPPRDRPILISGGSPMIIEQPEGKLKVIDARNLVTAYPDSRVTSIEVDSAGGRHQTVAFERPQQAEVEFAVGEKRIAVQTDPNGQNLRIAAVSGIVFSNRALKSHGKRFVLGAEPTPEKGPPEPIQLRILKGRVEQPLDPVSGHTRITIHYEGE